MSYPFVLVLFAIMFSLHLLILLAMGMHTLFYWGVLKSRNREKNAVFSPAATTPLSTASR